MSIFNITAQIYSNSDKHKQTILMNELVESSNQYSAENSFKLSLMEKDIVLLKILSTEEISQEAV